MRHSFLCFVGSVLVSSAAGAADLQPSPIEPMAPMPVAAEPFSWTGFYVGGQVGGGWLNGHARPDGFAAFDIDGAGVVYGGQLGYNYQVGQVVFGVEGDFTGATTKKTGTCSMTPLARCRVSENWAGSVRGRLGYAFDRAMVYGLGGVAFADHDIAQLAPIARDFGSSSRIGWTAGLGGEYAVTDQWSVALEWTYANYGGERVKSKTTPQLGATTRDADHTGVAKINYHF